MKKTLLFIILALLLSGCPVEFGYVGREICTYTSEDNEYFETVLYYEESAIVKRIDTYILPADLYEEYKENIDTAVEECKVTWNIEGATYETYLDEDGNFVEVITADYKIANYEELEDRGFHESYGQYLRSFSQSGYECEKWPEFDPDRV